MPPQDMGLGWGDANAAMAAQLRQTVADRIAAQQRAKQDQQQQFENDYKNRALAQADELKRAQLEDYAQVAKIRAGTAAQDAADREQNRMGARLEQIPMDTEVPRTTPIVGQLRSAGYSPVIPDKPVSIDAPPGFLASDLNAGPQPLPGTIANAPAPNQVMAQFTGTTKQHQAADELARKTQEAQDRADEKAQEAEDRRNAQPLVPVDQPGGPVYNTRQNAIGKKVFEKPATQQTIVVPGLDEQGNNVVRVQPKVSGAVYNARPNTQQAQQQYAAQLASGDVQAVHDRVDEAEQAGLLGPGAGRVYGQFLAGTIGSTGDPAADQKLGHLKAAIDNLKGSYPRAIIGGMARGSGTDRLQNVLNSDKFSADLMRAALDEIGGALARRTNKTGSGKIIVTDPNGGTHPFDTQAQADAFKASWPK